MNCQIFKILISPLSQWGFFLWNYKHFVEMLEKFVGNICWNCCLLLCYFPCFPCSLRCYSQNLYVEYNFYDMLYCPIYHFFFTWSDVSKLAQCQNTRPHLQFLPGAVGCGLATLIHRDAVCTWLKLNTNPIYSKWLDFWMGRISVAEGLLHGWGPISIFGISS